MAKRSTTGLYKKGEIWHIQKYIGGELIRTTTGETEIEQAERFLARLIEDRRKVKVYGEVLDRTFNTVAAKYIEEFKDKISLDRDITSLKAVMPYIGHLEIRKIHSGVFDDFIKERKASGITAGTLTRDFSVIRHVLRLCAAKWRDENGNAYLGAAPMLPTVDGIKRKPRPISWAEQERLLKELPSYLSEMVLFALNTGLRDQEICGMKWSDECKVTGLDTSVFIIEEIRSKNKYERIVPLNSVARSIVASRRDNKSEYVFDFKGRKLERMNNRAWRKAREINELKLVRVHDMRHTFGMRLRAAGVSIEDRQDLFGHHAGRITTHYSKVEISHLIDCVELLCENRRPELTLIRRVV